MGQERLRCVCHWLWRNESRLSASREVQERQCYSLRMEREREREREGEKERESMHIGRSRPVTSHRNLLHPSPEPRQQKRPNSLSAPLRFADGGCGREG
jgi:hypothetical protein